MDIGKNTGNISEMLKSYNAFIFNKKNFVHLRELCSQGKAADLKIRTFCWRVFY